MTSVPSEDPGPGVLERARIHAFLSVHELWMRYLALGGEAGPSEVAQFLTGQIDLGRREYNLLVDSLNERFADLRLDRPILYAH